ncbi:MAG: aromatic amino acid ammonia-lyase [Pseudomonadota bacterium]
MATTKLKFNDKKQELGEWLNVEDAYRIAAGDVGAIVSHLAQLRCADAAERLMRVIAERRHVYGITTGFGPLADRLIDPDEATTLQQNLVHHLASGVGPRHPWVEARAMVLARLNTILQGASGARAPIIALLTDVMNSDLAPVIPQRGTVGASGDLTPMAHVALALQGRGAFFDQTGKTYDADRGLRLLSVAPLTLAGRDGLALVNGTAAMTGVALCNAKAMRHLLDWSVALTAGLAEVLGGRAEAWEPAFATLRPHPGQAEVTRALLARIAGSDAVIWSKLAQRQIGDDLGRADWIGQDAYTLRCAPQVIGAVWDTAEAHEQTVEIELNAVTDNPIFPEDEADLALHGGNFMGQQIGLASDALANGVAVLAGLMERQVARLCDERLNMGLPAFLHRGPAGLNSGFMGAQVTATALLAEIRAIGPASCQSISTNGANQDVVSMGTIAARLARDKLTMASEIAAILALCVAQAMDLRRLQDGPAFSAAAGHLHAVIRAAAPEMFEDRPLGKEISAVANIVARQPPPQG